MNTLHYSTPNPPTMQKEKIEAKDYTDELMNEMYRDITEGNKIIDARNRRIFKAIKNVNGKAFLKNMFALLESLEVSSYMGVSVEYEIVRVSGKYRNETSEFGRKIKEYWIDQWSVGMEGDSYHGYAYIELKKGRYLKAPFFM